MTAATRPRPASAASRLLVVDPHAGRFHHASPGDLPRYLSRHDLLVVNDAATLPASLRLTGVDAEVRLITRLAGETEYRAVLLGAGDHRVPTERRGAPPAVRAGDRLELGEGLTAEITRVDLESRRLVDLRFLGAPAPLLRALYRHGKPIQYSYVPEPLALWDVQNRFAARPWAFELPSAGRALDGELMLALRRAGVALASVTHAAGISSTGSDALDRRLPLPERFEIPASTARAIATARVRGGRVLAVGTTVVRALEASAVSGTVQSGLGEARLKLDAAYRPRVVHGILSGMHEVGTSHFALLEAFAPRDLLVQATEAADRAGYRQHEFGDFCLIWSRRP